MQAEATIGGGVTSGDSGAGASNATTDTPSVTPSSGVPSEQSQGSVTAPVQGQESEPSLSDILKDLPSVDELNQQAGQGAKYAAGLANLRGRIEPLNQTLTELQSKYSPYESHLERFEGPEQLQNVVQLHDSLIGWTKDAQTGELIPNTQAGAEQLAQQYPRHADYLAADLLNGMTTDLATGRQMSRLDVALEGMAEVPEQRAKVAKMFGLVEPSQISPQWQPTAEQLAVVRPELQDVFKQLPYEEREDLSTMSPDYINRALEREKFTQDLKAERDQSQQREQQQIQQREQYVAQQAHQAGEQYVNTHAAEALTTFHNSVVEQCNFIEPLDTANLPQGMTPEQANQMNQQIAASNKAEAAQITGLVVNLINEQTRPYVLPLLKEIGVVDDKLIQQLDQASNGFGDNGRNFGELSYRGQLQANGQGFQPDASMTNLRNNADRNLKMMIHIANQVKSKLIEKRSQFFQMKAQGHNQTLNNVATSRQMVRGSTFDPNAAAAQQKPTGWASRQELERQYGA